MIAHCSRSCISPPPPKRTVSFSTHRSADSRECPHHWDFLNHAAGAFLLKFGFAVSQSLRVAPHGTTPYPLRQTANLFPPTARNSPDAKRQVCASLRFYRIFATSAPLLQSLASQALAPENSPGFHRIPPTLRQAQGKSRCQLLLVKFPSAETPE